MQLKKPEKTGFSVAEALIALLIGSCFLAMLAPLFSKRTAVNKIDYQSMKIPSGMVAFFNKEDCPDGWSPLDASYNGRFVRFSGDYNETFVVSGNTYEASLSGNVVGTKYNDSIRNVVGSFWSDIRYAESHASGPFFVSPEGRSKDIKSGDNRNGTIMMDLSRSTPTANEIRPRAIALLGCQKD